MKFREAQWAGAAMNLRRRHDARKKRPQLTMYAELVANEEERAWTRDATCAKWNATALPVNVPVVKFLDCLLVVPTRDVTQR